MLPPLRNILDLSPKESAFLDVLLRLKMARSVSAIASQAKLPRSTALYILRKFEKRGLTRKVLSGKRYLWMYDRKLDYVDRNIARLK